MRNVTNTYLHYIPQFMGLWRTDCGGPDEWSSRYATWGWRGT